MERRIDKKTRTLDLFYHWKKIKLGKEFPLVATFGREQKQPHFFATGGPFPTPFCICIKLACDIFFFFLSAASGIPLFHFLFHPSPDDIHAALDMGTTAIQYAANRQTA